MLRLVLVILLILGRGAAAQDMARLERQFQAWLDEVVVPRARAEGVPAATIRAALAGVHLDPDLPGLVLPGAAGTGERAQHQAEFRAPARYFHPARMAGAAATGRKLAARLAPVLERIERRTGVPGRIILAIWARESAYGQVAIPHDAFTVLASRAWASGDAGVLAELIAALRIAAAGHVPVERMKSSWAGALGQPQFMPRSFLAYAVDGDGDGRADIWGSEADTLASIGNFLAEHGWQRGRDWGFEVRLPEGLSCTLEGPDQARPIRDWERVGITRISGRPFPAHERGQESFLLLPAGRHGPAFLVSGNFSALKAYNRSDLYALHVGNLADRIAYGMGDFRAGWADLPAITRGRIARIQRGLEALGHDTGGVDGLPGFRTRRAIGRWQESRGERASCYPEPWMAAALARPD